MPSPRIASFRRAWRDAPFCPWPRPLPLGSRRPRDWTNHQPVRYPDPDILVLERASPATSFLTRSSTNTSQARNGPKVRPGARRAAICCGATFPTTGRCGWLEEDGHVSVFRNPSGYSNGNTFDFEGRQLSCEHRPPRGALRTRWPVTVLADKWNGKPLNSPNDIVVHPDGGIWFTDPGYGILGNYEGPGEAGDQGSGLSHRSEDGARSRWSRTNSTSPTASASRPTTRSSTSATPATPRDIQVFDVADNKLTQQGAVHEHEDQRQRPGSPMESAPISTATSGPVRMAAPGTMACTLFRRKASASA